MTGSSKRSAIRMSAEEMAAFLGQCRNLQVATLDADGAPHLTTVWFATCDGAFLFETYGKSQKVKNLRRDPRIAVLCEQGESYDQLRGVSVKGRAQIIDSGSRFPELMALLVDRNHPGMGPDRVAAIAADMCRKRVVVIVHPERVMTWDHRKLAGG